MQKTETSTTLCKNVFKNGKSTTTESNFTKKWIELVNTLKKSNCL